MKCYINQAMNDIWTNSSAKTFKIEKTRRFGACWCHWGPDFWLREWEKTASKDMHGKTPYIFRQRMRLVNFPSWLLTLRQLFLCNKVFEICKWNIIQLDMHQFAYISRQVIETKSAKIWKIFLHCFVKVRTPERNKEVYTHIC